MASPTPQTLVSKGNRLAVSNIYIGPVAYASIATNTADVANQMWVTDIWVPFNFLCSTVKVLQGGTATTDKVFAQIYDASGTLIANSSPTGGGTALSGANTFLSLSLVSSVTLYGPAQYYVAIQGNGTAAGALQIIPASTYADIVSSTIAGNANATTASITVPTAFAAGAAPVVILQ